VLIYTKWYFGFKTSFFMKGDSHMFLLRMLLLHLALCFSFAIEAEISDVTITWRAEQCKARCQKLLSEQFGKLYGVSKVDVNLAAGQANLTWKPNVPFSFYQINTAMRLVGPAISNIRMKIRGHIQAERGQIKVISEGDGTAFYLLNPITPSNTKYVITGSIYNRQLSPDTHKQLLDAAAKKQLAVVQGPLFEPYRSPPLYIVIEILSFEEPKTP
jgi:copper chaperone CopZ